MSDFQIKPVKSTRWQVFNNLKAGKVVVLEEGVLLNVPDDLPEKDALQIIEHGLATYVEGDDDGVVDDVDTDLDDDLDTDGDDELEDDVEDEVEEEVEAEAKPKRKYTRKAK